MTQVRVQPGIRPPRSRGLLVFTSRRLLAGAFTLLVISAVTFAACSVLPGDAAQQILGREATPEALAALRHQLGTDQSVVSQYAQWLEGVAHLDFGRSLSIGIGSGSDQGAGAPVSSLIGTPLANSAVLLAIVLVLLVPGSLLLGTWAALRRGSRMDHAVQVATLSFASMPEFVVGVLLVAVFSLWLGLLPAVSLGSSPSELVLPVATLVLTSLAWTTRLVRAGVIDVLNSDFVAMARLKGIDERRVVTAHVLPNAVGPALQAFALTTGYLAGGVIVVEYLFSYPGVGQELVAAVQTRDAPVVEAYTLIIACVYLVANLACDVLAAVFNPRLRDV